ncbi:transposase [Escherichia coli]|nr:transposase [Escherichia coli]
MCPALDPSVAGSAFMRGNCPVRVICLEIQLCFLTGALSWLIKLPKLPLWVAWIHIKICTLPLS